MAMFLPCCDALPLPGLHLRDDIVTTNCVFFNAGAGQHCKGPRTRDDSACINFAPCMFVPGACCPTFADNDITSSAVLTSTMP